MLHMVQPAVLKALAAKPDCAGVGRHGGLVLCTGSGPASTILMENHKSDDYLSSCSHHAVFPCVFVTLPQLVVFRGVGALSIFFVMEFVV